MLHPATRPLTTAAHLVPAPVLAHIPAVTPLPAARIAQLALTPVPGNIGTLVLNKCNRAECITDQKCTTYNNYLLCLEIDAF